MSGEAFAAAATQLVGGLVLAPLLVGLVQHWKARLQGRRGPSPLQPYRELARLWSRARIDVEGTTLVYQLAPPAAAAALAAAVLLVPVASAAPGLGVGHSMLALGGMLALARFSVSTAAWDTENGFALMGASRDLTISVFTEATLVLSLAVAALVAGTTDLTGIVAGTAGGDAWTSPGLALGAVGFALVVLAETGRQPFDNPDTHLELTLIHEGPFSSMAAAISRSCSGALLLVIGSSSCSRPRSSFPMPKASGSSSQCCPLSSWCSAERWPWLRRSSRRCASSSRPGFSRWARRRRCSVSSPG